MSRQRIFMSVCLLTTLLAPWKAALAGDGQGGPRPRVAVTETVDLPERMEDTRSRLRDLLEEEVRQHGFEVIRPPAGASCPDSSCLPTFAKSIGATEVLVVRGGKNGSHGYHIELSLWNAASGDDSPAIADCAVCTGPQMAEAVAKAARPLLDRVQALKAVAPPPTAVSPVPAPVVSNTTIPTPLEPSDQHSARRVLGWSLLGVGGAVAFGGGIIWSLNGKGTDCMGSSCRSTYQTQGEGIALLAGGLVAAGVGVWLVLDSPRGDLTVTFGPSGANLAGRF